jgi:hypothetical protein
MGPCNVYAVAKCAGELYLKRQFASYGIPYTIMRNFNTYGNLVYQRTFIDRCIRVITRPKQEGRRCTLAVTVQDIAMQTFSKPPDLDVPLPSRSETMHGLLLEDFRRIPPALVHSTVYTVTVPLAPSVGVSVPAVILAAAACVFIASLRYTSAARKAEAGRSSEHNMNGIFH